jgi:V/A-type H+-transporting ATPase subunit F
MFHLIYFHYDYSPSPQQKSKGIKRDSNKRRLEMQIIAIGSRVFVTSFQLAGVKGIKVETASEALTEINMMDENSGVGLVLLSDDLGKQIRNPLTSLRAKRPIPLIFELPSPGSKKEKVDYRALLKQILGV